MSGTLNGPGKHEPKTGNEDGYVRRFSPQGELLREILVATDETDDVNQTIVFNGKVYVGGQTLGAFDGANAGGYDGLLAVYSVASL